MIALRGLHDDLRPHAEAPIRFAESLGFRVTVTSVYRSERKQRALFENFQACQARGVYPSSTSLRPGYSCRWPAAKPGFSAHNYGLAWDSTIEDPQRRYDQGTLDGWWVAVRRWWGWEVDPESDRIHAQPPGWAA